MPVSDTGIFVMNMNLAIDIGNTFVHFGVFRGQKLVEQVSVPNSDLPAIKKSLNFLLKRYDISGVAIASVNPKAEQIIRKLLPKTLKALTLTVSNEIKLPVSIKVQNSATLGTDRICNAVYGYMKSAGKDSLVIDLGTANTYDLVLKDGSFLGGIIAPGLTTSALALNTNTAKLPVVSVLSTQKRIPLIGRNTQEAISSGLLHYMLFATEGIVAAAKKQYGRNLQVYLTGGSAKLIASKVNFKCKYVQNTVLEGLNMIINLNKP